MPQLNFPARFFSSSWREYERYFEEVIKKGDLYHDDAYQHIGFLWISDYGACWLVSVSYPLLS